MFLTNILDGASWYLFRFNIAEYGLFDFCRSVAFWLTVALIIAFLIGVAVNKENRAKVMKVSGIIAVCYAAALAVLFSALTFVDDGVVWQTFLPILIAALLIIATMILLGVCKDKTVHIVMGVLSAVALVVALVMLGIYYATGKPAEDNGLTNEQVETIGLYVSSVLLVIVLIALALLLDKGEKGFSTKSIAYAAVCIAMSFALSYIRIVRMPQGGSITVASLFPLMLYSYMFGTKKGVFAGMIYGMLQAVQNTYILHPAQFLLDYPIAFAAIGLAGMFANNEKIKAPQLRFALGAVLAGLARFISHFFSGMFAFGAFAHEGQSPFMYSLTYQFMYVMPDIVILVIVGVLVLSSKSFVSQIDKIRLSEARKVA